MEERPLDDAHLPPLTMPDLSPEARRKRARESLREKVDEHVGPEGRFWQSRFFKVVARVWAGAYHDGFIHAGNLAYMAILALFPFFITVGAGFSLFGEQAQRETSVHAFLAAMPPVVATALEPVAMDVIVARTGNLLWIGGLVGLWTVGSLIETIRDILRRAYGTRETLAYWRYRLISTGVIVLAVIAMLFALIAQVLIGTAQEVIQVSFPRLYDWISTLGTSRLVSVVVIYAALYLLFFTLTPKRLPQPPLSQVAGGAAGHDLVGRSQRRPSRRALSLFYIRSHLRQPGRSDDRAFLFLAGRLRDGGWSRTERGPGRKS